jgi:3-methyladenine DNA glycosylase AlkD
MSEPTTAANAFVARHLRDAMRLGDRLADLVTDPLAFQVELASGLGTLADPGYAAAQERVAPGSGAVIGVRWPLLHAIGRQLRPALRETSPSLVLDLATRLARTSPTREERLMALPCLRECLPEEPERAWQELRRMGHAATDWITVDNLAEVFAQGILAEPFRWAELEQLIYSRQPMERRLVGATLARLPHGVPARERPTLRVGPVLALVGQLIGDADPWVRRSLSWALREWSRVAPDEVAAFLEDQATLAQEHADGHRAWVVRDSLAHLPTPRAAAIRARVDGIRTRPGAPASSDAAATAARYDITRLASTAVAQQGDRYARSHA